MKTFRLTIIFGIFIYSHQVQSQNLQLKNYNGNSLEDFKGERQPFASTLDNDNYNRDKREASQAIIKFQEALIQAKYECVREMNMNSNLLGKSLLYEEDPTEMEKCLMMCMLQKTKFMEANNKISIKTVARIAGDMSEDNPLVVSIAVASANNCNKFIRTDEEPCEAAYQINKCIGNELKAHKLKLYY